MIDAATFAQFAPRASLAYARLAAAPADAYGISTPLRIAHWMAQMAVECAYFARFEENLNYSAERLRAVWPSRFTAANATAYAFNPEKLANLVYADRMGNGDTASGDGWAYRGRGALMNTGRAAYANVGAITKLPLVDQPELLADPEHAFLAAAIYWQATGCNALADADDLEAVTRRVNGGLTDLDQRAAGLTRAKQIWH